MNFVIFLLIAVWFYFYYIFCVRLAIFLCTSKASAKETILKAALLFSTLVSLPASMVQGLPRNTDNFSATQ